MAVLTAGRKSERKQGILFELPVAATAHIYAGSLVSVNGNGYLVPSSDASGERMVGVARKEANNSGGANGDILCEGYLSGLFHMNGSGITNADMLKDAYVADDNTVSGAIVAQPVNVTGVTVEPVSMTVGGTRALAFTFATTTLSYGGGTAVDVSVDGSYVLTATDGSSVNVTVIAASLPGADQSDNIQVRHQKAGRIVEVLADGSTFIDISAMARG